MILFCYRRKLPFLQITDLVVSAVPIGLGFGRIGNFINAELWGRTTTISWGVIFPGAGPLPRHPSQLYEAALEGALLWLVIYLLHNRQVRLGFPSFCFLILYGCFRFFVEFFRQPDSHLGFLWGGATMGQLLSLPMILVGVAGFIFVSQKAKL
jgi:phosphatidylglycerol:prolipoprotein diacylglycerol transferase